MPSSANRLAKHCSISAEITKEDRARLERAIAFENNCRGSSETISSTIRDYLIRFYIPGMESLYEDFPNEVPPLPPLK